MFQDLIAAFKEAVRAYRNLRARRARRESINCPF
jgi:hypothetical protein